MVRSGVLAVVLVLCGTSLGLLPADTADAALPASITGTLGESGMTVVAVATDGRSRVVRAPSGTFRIRPPAARVALHLRRRDGRYAGPVVMATANDGRRAILGVRAGTRLGRIRVSRTGGYARVARRPAARRIDTRLFARARGGVPRGARVFGRVRSARASVPGDPDADGLPDVLDIDDDGDLVLDNLDRSRRARAAQVTGFDTRLQLRSVLPVGINDAANANAGATAAQADETLARAGYLIVSEVAGDSAELDCGLLTYCSRGGTGSVFGSPVPPLPPFPACCDADGDGLGTIARNPSLPGRAGMFLRPGATTAEIRTGDLLIERVTTGGVETAYPATLQYVFAMAPALRAYRDTAVPAPHEATVTYPVPYGAPGSPGATFGFPVAAGPGGDVVLRLTLWRPQRRRIAGEAGSGEWTDIGGLTYVVNPMVTGIPMIGACPQDSLTEPSAGLVPPVVENVPGPNQNGVPGGGFYDTTPDRAADPGNVVSFTVNVTRCLASAGGTWPRDTEVNLNLRALAANAQDSTEQVVAFRRVR